MDNLDYAYRELGLSPGPGVTLQEVRRAYLALALRTHPDKPTGDVARFQRVHAAYTHILQHEGAADEDAAVGSGPPHPEAWRQASVFLARMMMEVMARAAAAATVRTSADTAAEPDGILNDAHVCASAHQDIADNDGVMDVISLDVSLEDAYVGRVLHVTMPPPHRAHGTYLRVDLSRYDASAAPSSDINDYAFPRSGGVIRPILAPHPVFRVEDGCLDLHTEVLVTPRDFFLGRDVTVRLPDGLDVAVRYAGGNNIMSRVTCLPAYGMRCPHSGRRGALYVFFKLRMRSVDLTRPEVRHALDVLWPPASLQHSDVAASAFSDASATGDEEEVASFCSSSDTPSR